MMTFNIVKRDLKHKPPFLWVKLYFEPLDKYIPFILCPVQLCD